MNPLWPCLGSVGRGSSVAFPVLIRSHSGIFPEEFGKIGKIGIACLHGYLVDGPGCGCQQLSGLGHFSFGQIAADGKSGFLLEKFSQVIGIEEYQGCLLYTSPSPRDRTRSRMPSSA